MERRARTEDSLSRRPPRRTVARSAGAAVVGAALSIVTLTLSLLGCGGGGGGGGGDGGGGGGGGGQPAPIVMLDAAGGTVNVGPARITAPAGIVLGSVGISASTTTLPVGLPAGFTAAGDAVDITVTDPEALDGPLVVQLSYDDAAIPDEEAMVVLHVDAAGGCEPVTLLEHDTAANTITFDSRVFSPFVIAFFDGSLVPASHTVTGFAPSTRGWSIANRGGYFTPGGNCLGMSGYCAWFFENRPQSLFGHFPSAGSPSIAQIVASRAHLAQSQYWARKSFEFAQLLGERRTGVAMKALLALFDEPLVLILGDPNPAHASVVYGYDGDEFLFYDVNLPGAEQSVSFSEASGFGTYGGYTEFGFVAIPSLGRLEDFEGLTQEAEGGFVSSQDIAVLSPADGEQVAARDTQLRGSLSGSLLTQGAEVVAYVKGVPQSVAVNPATGEFATTIPVSNGTNTIILLAGDDIRHQSSWHRGGATLIRDIEGGSPATDLLVTLTWEQDGTDVDLYVTEPSGDTAFYQSLRTPSGLTLDFDNTSGLGPEHVTLSRQSGVTVQPGTYVVRVHYYSDHGTGLPASGRVSIVLGEGTTQQRIDTLPFTIASSDPANDAPAGSGPDWADIAVVDVQGLTVTAP